jgi:hypothetical protein
MPLLHVARLVLDGGAEAVLDHIAAGDFDTITILPLFIFRN